MTTHAATQWEQVEQALEPLEPSPAELAAIANRVARWSNLDALLEAIDDALAHDNPPTIDQLINRAALLFHDAKARS